MFAGQEAATTDLLECNSWLAAQPLQEETLAVDAKFSKSIKVFQTDASGEPPVNSTCLQSPRSPRLAAQQATHMLLIRACFHSAEPLSAKRHRVQLLTKQSLKKKKGCEKYLLFFLETRINKTVMREILPNRRLLQSFI